MSTKIQSDLQRNLARYLKGDLKLNEFEDWFVTVLWPLNNRTDTAARQLAGSISNLIAETSRGDRTVESLYKELENVLRSEMTLIAKV